MAEGRARGFSVATKCVTVDDLIEKFRDRVDETSILVNPVEHRDVGTECAFAILLADRKPAIAGTCIVRDVYRDGNNPFKRPGMRLEIKRLGPESQKVFAELVATRVPPRKMTTMFPVVAPPPEPREPAPVIAVPAINVPSKPVIVMPRSAKARTEAPRTKTHSDVVAPRPVVSTSPIVPPRTSTSTLGSRSAVAHRIQQHTTQPIRGLREEPVQIPQIDAREDEPLARAPRATPFDLDNVAKIEPLPLPDESAPEAMESVPTEPLVAFTPKLVPAAAETVAEPVVPTHIQAIETQPLVAIAVKPAAPAEPIAQSSVAEPAAESPRPRRVETRTPHSPFILPANPLAEMTDASLEGFVDRRLLEGASTAPAEFLAVTHDADDPAVIRDAVKPAELAAADAVMRASAPALEPLPLPPPPQAGAVPPMPRAEPLPYAATKLPDLNTNADDQVWQRPVLKQRLTIRLLLAVTLVPLIGAAAVVGYMRFVAAPDSSAIPPSPEVIATLDEPATARATIEPAPAPEDAVAGMPAGNQPIHAVLVKSYPIAARVTVGDRFFGTTPTYVKIPANTPVEIVLKRPGFKPATYPMTSKKLGGTVFVKLERRGGR